MEGKQALATNPHPLLPKTGWERLRLSVIFTCACVQVCLLEFRFRWACRSLASGWGDMPLTAGSNRSSRSHCRERSLGRCALTAKLSHGVTGAKRLSLRRRDSASYLNSHTKSLMSVGQGASFLLAPGDRCATESRGPERLDISGTQWEFNIWQWAIAPPRLHHPQQHRGQEERD